MKQVIIEAVLHIQTKNLNLNFCRKWSQCLMNFDLSFCQAFMCECVSISVRTGWSKHASLKTMVWNLNCTRNTNTSLENDFCLLRNTLLLFKSKLAEVMLVAGALSRVSDKVKLHGSWATSSLSSETDKTRRHAQSSAAIFLNLLKSIISL